ncbi:MAG TPA: methylenetetrahydrofolate reductase [Solirubrobacteraceae bacterium]|nr:methylenetetrahydrofolate reductase [Solirubrobacteraceae bacterium]
MPTRALTSAEISLPGTAEPVKVRERIALLADTVDIVGLTDNHAGQARMSPLAAVALAREQGVRTIVHVSCRDRNRLALRSQVLGAAALGSEGVLCVQGDPAGEAPPVRDLKATELIGRVWEWAAPRTLEAGAVVNPFVDDADRELRLLERKVAAGASFVQSQMVFDLDRLARFLERAADLLAGVRFYASVALLRSGRMGERAARLPGVVIPEGAERAIARGDGIELATRLASELATLDGVDALHVFPLGAERETREVAGAFRAARGMPARRP